MEMTLSSWGICYEPQKHFALPLDGSTVSEGTVQVYPTIYITLGTPKITKSEPPMLSNEEIEIAKRAAKYSNDAPLHEHLDCVRMAYEWLDAQKKTRTATTATNPLKHFIEKWAGRYVSTSDVEVAAYMHPDIKGVYPYFNISARLTEPSTERLKGISEAFKHSYRDRYDPSIYKLHE